MAWILYEVLYKVSCIYIVLYKTIMFTFAVLCSFEEVTSFNSLLSDLLMSQRITLQIVT